MASTQFVPTYKRETKDEFFVSQSKVNIVSQYKDKIERMYEIDITFEDEVDDGQWLILEGEPVDKKNAKNYIIALCHPAEVKQIQFPSAACAEFTGPMTLEQIEKQTSAVIRPLEKVAHFETCGTELAVTLAMSMMEELCASVKDSENKCMENWDESEKDVITISPATHNASLRLSSVLERALSQHSDGVCSMVDYEYAPQSVKRVLVNCLQDTEEFDNIDDDLLFADGNAVGKTDDTKLNMFKTESENTVNDDGAERVQSMEVDGVEHYKTSPGVVALSDKLTEATISIPSMTPLVSKQYDYLRSFGISVGYKSDEVNEALQFVDEKTRPSDFLDLLSSVKQKQEPANTDHDVSDDADDEDNDVVILETETIDTTKTPDPPSASGGGRQGNLKPQRNDESVTCNSNLPDGYKERLIMDFFQEDDNSSREELKRRNAERQKLLRENFQKQKQQQQKPQESGSQQNGEGQNVGKKKGKTKNQKKKQRQQQQQQQKQQQGEQKEERNDLHDKQLRLDSSENQTYSKDGDQTCVFRVWNNDGGSGSASGKKSEPIVTTPKRKQSQPGNTQRSNSQPIASKINPRQNPQQPIKSPVNNQRSQPLANRQNQQMHSPSRSHQWKPTQVVTPSPTNAFPGPSRPLPAVPSIGQELRYIVIDGSNVAMSHGNGKYFSCKGLRICVDYFKRRGHKITVFVPHWRKCQPSDTNAIMDQHILEDLKEEEVLVFTPSRRIGRKLVVAYDDRFVLELAEAEDGIIVSNDQYRDLMMEKANWRKLIEERLLMFSYAGDHFMPPNDPLGRDGPCLDVFLKKSNTQPFSGMGRPNANYMCQYGNQQNPQQGRGQYNMSKDLGGQEGYRQGYKQGQGQTFKTVVQPQYYNPPDRHPHEMDGLLPAPGQVKGWNGQRQPFKTVVQPQHHNQPDRLSDEMDGLLPTPGQVKGWKGQQRGQAASFNAKGQGQGQSIKWCTRSEEETEKLFRELKAIFPEPDQEEKLRNVLGNHEKEMDLTKLTNYCMSVLF